MAFKICVVLSPDCCCSWISDGRIWRLDRKHLFLMSPRAVTKCMRCKRHAHQLESQGNFSQCLQNIAGSFNTALSGIKTFRVNMVKTVDKYQS